MEGLPSLATYVAMIFVIQLLATCYYQFFVHPLGKYPGPLVAAITDGYCGFYALLRRLHLVTYQNHKKYGAVIRHGPDRLIFNTARALQASQIPSIFNVIDRDWHRIKRKLIGQAISERSMRAFEPTMTDQINILLRELLRASQDPKSQPINMTQRFKWLGIDIVGLLAFGYALNTQTNPRNRFIIPGMISNNYRNNCFIQFPLLKKLGLDQVAHVFTYNLRRRYLFMLQQMISNRLGQELNARIDLFSFVAKHIHTPAVEGIPASELWSEAIFFFPAGGDTVSTALSALLFYLSQNEDVYQKLANEVRKSFLAADNIRGGPQLSSCRYLRCCIDEALRMSPPITGTLWRELSSEDVGSEPLIVDGHVIPPGTQVGVNIYSLHHNESYFPEPFVFRPERWMVEDKDALRVMNSAFTPFSIGSRGCAGKAMAYLEISLVVAKIFWYFDFEPAPGPIGNIRAGGLEGENGQRRCNEYQMYDIFASAHDGPNLVFFPRGDLWKELEPGPITT